MMTWEYVEEWKMKALRCDAGLETRVWGCDLERHGMSPFALIVLFPVVMLERKRGTD